MNWQTPMEKITGQLSAVLQENLIGVYLHGSACFDCATESSNLDFIVVLRTPLRTEKKEAIIRMMLDHSKEAPAKGLEMSVVLEEDCRNFIYPTPYQLHFSPVHQKRYEENLRGYCKKMQGVDFDLAAHFTVIKQKGIVLFGKEIDSVFGEIPFSDYLDSIWRDVCTASEDILREPVSVLLNLCRVWAAFAEQKVLSKPQGADWALPLLPFFIAEQVKQAKTCYQKGVLWNASQEGLEKSARYLLKKIEELRLK